MEIDGKSIEMVAVVSSNIDSVGYYKEESKLIVQFKSNGYVYAYYNVTEPTYRDLLIAESAGKFLATFIKPNHTFTRIR